MIGFGGIVVMDATSTEASQRVSQAIDYGINYFDVAPTYGNAEEMLGPALEAYRKGVFLACKTQARDRDGALKERRCNLLLSWPEDHGDQNYDHQGRRTHGVRFLRG